MSGPWPFALGCAVLTGLLAELYRRVWRRSAESTPTGFGVLLAPALLAAALLVQAPDALTIALAITTAGALVYWIDDVAGLGAWLRVGISAVAGCAVGVVYFWSAGFALPALLALVLLAGFVNVALVNTINFQDGADLNLATFILLTSVLLLVYAGGHPVWTQMAVACLAFTLPFAVVNSRPRTLYFGDSGSFAFALFLTILGAAFLAGGAPPPEAAIAAALPVVDMAFVTAHRIRIRQRFTVRHYFHLYQRLQKDQRGFFYLVPQLVNVALSLAASAGLRAAGLGPTESVVLGTAAVTLPVFLAFRWAFVSSEPGPPVRLEGRA